jgi:hypothetical protein
MSSLMGKFYYFRPKFIDELWGKDRSSNVNHLKYYNKKKKLKNNLIKS